MSALDAKLAQLDAAIAAQVATLGLKFVNGPDPAPWTPPVANAGTNNGRQRGVYLFGVAEA